METGPLVVLESFAAGVPVLGSDLGGIAEWITHDHDGLLLAHDSTEVWSKAIQRIADEPGVLSRFRSNIQPPRSMREVAMDMLGIYQELQTAH